MDQVSIPPADIAISEILRPMIERALSDSPNDVAAVLHQAKYRAMEAIERLCDKAQVPTRNGHMRAYGPITAGVDVACAVVVATQTAGIGCYVATWPELPGPMPEVPDAEVTNDLIRAVHTADHAAMIQALWLRLGNEGVAVVRDKINQVHQMDQAQVPLLLALMGIQDDQDDRHVAVGGMLVLALPSPLDLQTAFIETHLQDHSDTRH